VTRAAAGVAAACVVALGACSFQPYFQREPRPPTDVGDWASVRDHFTRAAKIYDGFSTNAFISAVYQSPAVREARVARLATWKAMTAEEREKLLAAEREEAAQYDEFLVSVFTPNRADNDLDANPSNWRVALVVKGQGESLPVQVVSVRTDATLRQLYPMVGDFDVAYRVRFARVDPPIVDRVFTLRLAGAIGRVDLVYDPARSP
jgi:hypothetical protein